MKILALSGSNANNSFNEALLKFISKHFADKYDFKFATVKGLPMFKEGEDAPEAIQTLSKQIEDADLVLIGSPEQQHSVTSALSSALEWLSCVTHPFKGKPVAIVSTSPMPQGGSRSQSRLKSLLTAPGFGAKVFNGDEFMMGVAPTQFDDNGDLKDESTVKFLGQFFDEVDSWYAQVTK
ncbi:NADPH-dependent FMN reductase [Lactobacillus kullabergensis]|uniref:NADPH-dependent FMN reductase n=1 Tax=Lactobacillus kullabergensis TaxID=1218493 RepID=A0A0F4LJG3_9LACO|nr:MULTISPECIES: NAD(P)H-dependent oxidoreductase [Lactobacillus]AWM74695.1 NADPH-dependent oxidoreductase [Lactobacillus kullabergensis]KJY58982.1 NADPH-dependent FMN reductase [Lactobacillus kullabergensis]MBC6370661.1 NADPH-dependent oxidoreductase [Lactobacillus kullabergensis]RMC56884.1 NADPH-dependent oxidoreductase [Lactobacillus sp. ESL0261]